jgi:hypothetical protein
MSRSELVDVVYTFWPLPVSVVIATASGVFGVPWLGLLILIPLLLARRLYWSCSFGFFNAIIIVVCIVGCLMAFVRQLVGYAI